MYTGRYPFKNAIKKTMVCGSIIYVDRDANTGANNGTSWDNAYLNLQDAFSKAQDLSPAMTAIWVAAGTYQPVNDVNVSDYQNKSFDLPDNTALLGHFAGYENSPYQRNFADSNNETILDGQIGSNPWEAVYHVVKAQNISSGLIDGFTIKNS